MSAVRFCPWPLRRNHNSRAEIGPDAGTVAARARFGRWRGIWRDLFWVLRAPYPELAPKDAPPDRLREAVDLALASAYLGLLYGGFCLVVLVLALVAMVAAGAR